MPRYFLELSYKGTRYSGFQVQENANTIQYEVEKALKIFFRKKLDLTSSSRTDAGVHARQNFFHFDFDETITQKQVFNLNSILPGDIVVNRIIPVSDNAHSRFDAVAREYRYYIYRSKSPFLTDTAFFYPYTLELAALQHAASVISEYSNFRSFSKKRTQVKTYDCRIMVSEWYEEGGLLIYHVKANRFLRGMVKGLVGTMLRVGRGKITVDMLREIIKAEDAKLADFSVPGHGLFLERVEYPENYFTNVHV